MKTKEDEFTISLLFKYHTASLIFFYFGMPGIMERNQKYFKRTIFRPNWTTSLYITYIFNIIIFLAVTVDFCTGDTQGPHCTQHQEGKSSWNHCGGRVEAAGCWTLAPACKEWREMDLVGRAQGRVRKVTLCHCRCPVCPHGSYGCLSHQSHWELSSAHLGRACLHNPVRNVLQTAPEGLVPWIQWQHLIWDLNLSL